MKIAERIHDARLSAGLTLEELADKCSTTKQTIYKYEQGIVTNIPIDRVEKLAQALGVSPSYLMGWSDGEVQAFNAGTVLGKAAKDKNQIQLLSNYQKLNSDNQGKLLQFSEALTLL